MGNITSGSTHPRDTAEVAARIGARLGAQRVDLFGFADGVRARLTERWCAPGASTVGPAELPLGWFPWSLGNIRPEEYMFIRNAGALSIAPGDRRTIADLAMRSVVHLPVVDSPANVIGAVCAYWSDEPASWDSSVREPVCSWARDALSARR